jgi:hypothetical protein
VFSRSESILRRFESGDAGMAVRIAEFRRSAEPERNSLHESFAVGWVVD